MLVGIKNDRSTGRPVEYIVATPDGEKFSIKAGWTFVKVPTRDGTGTHVTHYNTFKLEDTIEQEI